VFTFEFIIRQETVQSAYEFFRYMKLASAYNAALSIQMVVAHWTDAPDNPHRARKQIELSYMALACGSYGGHISTFSHITRPN